MHSPRELGPGIHRFEGPGSAARAAELSALPGVVTCESDDAVDQLLRAGSDGVTGSQVEELRSLAARAVRARGIAERTYRRAAAAAGGRLAGGTAVAIHPDAVRTRAAAVVAAREALVEAERAIGEHDASTPPSTQAGAEAPEVTAEESALHLRARRNQAVGSLVAAFGLVLVLLATGVLPLWAALIIPLGASILALRMLGGSPRPAPEAAEPRSLLDDVDSFTGAGAGAGALDAARARLEVTRTLAEEDLRVAERSWHDLVGPDQAVEDVDEVVRRFDPHHDAAEEVAVESLSVRAMATAAGRLAEQWSARWEALGRSAPGLDDDPAVEEALSELQRETGPATVVLSAAVASRADEVAQVLPEAAVVVVSADVAGAS